MIVYVVSGVELQSEFYVMTSVIKAEWNRFFQSPLLLWQCLITIKFDIFVI